MAYPLDAATEEDMAAGLIHPAHLVDFYVKDGDGEPAFLRGWTRPGQAQYKADDPETVTGAVGATEVTYESMFERLELSGRPRMAATLASEPLSIFLDASRSGDNGDFVGRLQDRAYHQCRMRVRSVLMNPSTAALRSQPHWEWHGLIDHPNLTRQAGSAQRWELKCQGGLFRVRGRRLRNRTHADQQRRKAGDQFYLDTPIQVSTPLIWAKSQASLPAVVTNGGVNNVPGGKGKIYEYLGEY